MRTRTLVGVLCAVSAIGVVPAVASADESFVPDATPDPNAPGDPFDVPSSLAAAGDRVVFARRDENNMVAISEGFGETARPLPVKPAPFIGSVDLGTDARGRAVVVYDRCGAAASDRCDLYRFSFASGKESRLRFSRRACDESGARIERGVVVFFRASRRSRRPERRCKGGLFQKRPGQALRRLEPAVTRRGFRIGGFDIARGLLAVQRSRTGPDDPELGARVVSEIRLRRGKRPSRLVARGAQRISRASEGEGSFLAGPELSGGFVYWNRDTVLEPGDFSGRSRENIMRRAVRGGPVTSLARAGRLWAGTGETGADQTLYDFTVAGGELFYRYGDDVREIGRVAPRPLVFD